MRRQRWWECRRGAFAVLADAGMEALRVSWPAYGRGIGERFARHLSEGEARILTDALPRVRDAAQEP